MGRINVLPDSLINRIAAGEVVERPASVLKELVENALDSGAQAIEIAVRSGGKRSLRVVDDGCGMDRDDALLAFERHATSKLSNARDLEAIATLGFRGEALSSIAAVSRFVLRTAPEDGLGTEIEVKGGKILSVAEAGSPRGTAIDVERLFFNVPARRKFLKSDATELSHIVRLAANFALSYPRVRFRLCSEQRQLIDAAPHDELADRIAELYGRSFVEKLLPFDRRLREVRVRGFAGRPAESLPRRDRQHYFVNGRIVQDRMLSHAVGAAYGNTMARGRYPALFLYVDLDPGLVDVNVHPRKIEVRFRRSSEVHDAVRDVLTAALSHEVVVPTLADLRPHAAGVARAVTGFLDTAEPAPTVRYHPAEAGREWGEQTAPHRAVPVAQYLGSYIIAQDDEGLVIVDQHAAHERILFERYLAEAEENRVEVQKLLFPITIELAPHEHVVMENEAEEMRRLGFLIEPFGGRTVRLDGVPALAGEQEPESLLRELLGEASRARSAASEVESLRRRLVTTAACKAAIKINHPLTHAAMQGLLDDLFETVSPSTCPHGRPLFFRLTLDELEKAFDRR